MNATRDNRFSIISDESGARLDLFLAKKLSLTRTKVKSLIEAGLVRVDGSLPKPAAKIKKGAVLVGVIPAEEPLQLAPEEIPLHILYEDAYLMAVNKPPDMVVHPSFGHKAGTLVNAILGHLGGRSRYGDLNEPAADDAAQESVAPQSWPRPGIVHRLDKDTTGVILVAKDTRTQEQLSALFKDRAVVKIYRAVVEGAPASAQGLIEGNIGRHPVERKKMAVVAGRGREAATGYKVLRNLRGFSYVEAYPKTGRTHQIRVHLAHCGHPVVGDETYGKKAKKLAGRPLLHAYSIAFTHPATGGQVFITAPVPQDMEEFIAAHAL